MSQSRRKFVAHLSLWHSTEIHALLRWDQKQVQGRIRCWNASQWGSPWAWSTFIPTADLFWPPCRAPKGKLPRIEPLHWLTYSQNVSQFWNLNSRPWVNAEKMTINKCCAIRKIHFKINDFLKCLTVHILELPLSKCLRRTRLMSKGEAWHWSRWMGAVTREARIPFVMLGISELRQIFCSQRRAKNLFSLEWSFYITYWLQEQISTVISI